MKEYNQLRKKFGYSTITREQLRVCKKSKAKQFEEKVFLQNEYREDFVKKMQDESEGTQLLFGQSSCSE